MNGPDQARAMERAEDGRLRFCLDLLARLGERRFFGQIRLTYKKGRIVNCQVVESIKLDD
ncbi:MAG: hypothetical protein KKB20_18935 [Proteobacteria bacterium]|nr:hypothetical protein [Pseudomonadota bacterium]